MKERIEGFGRWTSHPLLSCLLTAMSMGCVFSQSPQVLDLAELKPLHAVLSTCEGPECAAASAELSLKLQDLLVAAEENGTRQISPCDFMAAIESIDGRLKVFTWNWPQSDRTSSYAGLVAFRRSDDAPLEFTPLLDLKSSDAPALNQTYKAEEWHGALYFGMVPDAVDKDTWLLLGWDDADAQVTRKVIEPVEMRPRGMRFGAPVLSTDGRMAKRWILEYADAVQASLRFQPMERGRDGHPERIVFDHLAPQAPHLTGIAAYYGPDMTFDAFVPGNRPGTPWQLQQNVTVIQALPGSRPFNDPRTRNGRNNRR